MLGGRMKVKECSICEREIKGKSHNAEPLSSGICCDLCNTLVVQKRLMDIHIQDIERKQRQ
jgi:hypothetical protein